MRLDRAWLLAFLTVLGCMHCPSQVSAQYQSFYPSTYSTGMGNTGAGGSGTGAGGGNYMPPVFNINAMPAAYMQPQPAPMPQLGAPEGAMPPGPSPYGPMSQGQMGDYVDAHGDPIDPSAAAPGNGLWGGSGCGEGCGDGYGDGYGGGHPVAGWLWSVIRPQCGPRWFNVHAEAINFSRNEITDQNRVFTREGLLGPAVLSTNDLDLDESVGFRTTLRYEIGPASNIEASYFGTFFWDSAAQVSSNNDNLYSVFSDFGLAPFGGFLETDQAWRQRIEYNSELNNVELNYRRHWSLFPVQGSWMGGVRYTSLNERFRFNSQVNHHVDPFTGMNRGPAYLDYKVGTTNDLVGLQIGGDIYVCVINRFSVGVDAKAGIYGNNAQQNTNITGTTLGNGTIESDHETVAAFIGELGLVAVYQICEGISIRAGYQFLQMNGVALAPENFNSGPPQVAGARTVGINTSGEALYEGASLGFEWLW